MKSVEKLKFPLNDGKGHITNLNAIKEIRIIDVINIEEINECIKKNWIFICMKSNHEMLLGRI